VEKLFSGQAHCSGIEQLIRDYYLKPMEADGEDSAQLQ